MLKLLIVIKLIIKSFVYSIYTIINTLITIFLKWPKYNTYYSTYLQQSN